MFLRTTKKTRTDTSASITVSRIPEAHHQKALYLHFYGNALLFLISTKDFDKLLKKHRKQYGGARNFELDLHSHKFKEQQDDFFTDFKP